MRKILLITVLFLVLVPLVALGAQDELPDIYSVFFNATILQHVAVVVGVVKVVRNMVNVKGPWAVVITVVASLFYGFVQFGANGDTWYFGLMIGALAAGSFYITKKFGKNLNPKGIK